MRRYQQTKYALGSAAYLTLVLPDDEVPNHWFEELWRRIEVFEQRFSRFRPDSELSDFNHSAGKQVAVTKEFRTLLVRAKAMARRTGSLYNPFVLPALQRAGYRGSWPQPEAVNPQVNYEDRKIARWEDMQLGKGWVNIPPNTALDFGGIGKGYLLDQLSDWLQKQGIENYWLSLGGDVVCAGLDEPGTPWRIGVQHARRETKPAAQIANDGKVLAVATSGVTKRSGVRNGTKWHHIIDPRTGRPATTDILTATVCSSSATEADVFAKCLVIVGSTNAEQFLRAAKLPNALVQLEAGDAIMLKRMGTIWAD
ncbi:MAG TPA: FAD:protein FMN transferase [Candidatus Saccharimonadales bacterium]|nr:FAD:protein FMN transferase [Candidatus Saccharimonadales bacterium]